MASCTKCSLSASNALVAWIKQYTVQYKSAPVYGLLYQMFTLRV